MPEHIGPAAGNGFSSGQIESITSVEAPVDGQWASALPNLPVKVVQEQLNPVIQSADNETEAPLSEGTSPLTFEERKDIMTREYQGLTSAEIDGRIREDFFNPDEGKSRLHYLPKRSKGTPVEGTGNRENVVVGGDSMDLRLFGHARHLHQLSKRYAATLGIEKEQQAKALKRADREQSAAAEEARKKIDNVEGDGKVSIDLFKAAQSIEEIDRLTGFWAAKGYVGAAMDEQGETTYQTPKSARFDKGKLMAGNSILDLRQEALKRVSKIPGAPADSSEPVAPDNEPRTVYEDLLKLQPYDAQRPDDSMASRLAVLGKAYEEAGNDSDELGLVIGQAFRLGLIVREYPKDPETGQALRPVVKALSPEVDKWYGEANAHYQEVISHSDKEQEAAEQETFYPYTGKSVGWIKSRIAMFKRRS